MSTQPKALFFADVLDSDPRSPVLHVEAAEELRRLHAENERLHQINQSHEMKLSVRGYEIQIEDLKAANGELLETLKEVGPILVRMYGPQAETLPPMQRVRAALKAALEPAPSLLAQMGEGLNPVRNEVQPEQEEPVAWRWVSSKVLNFYGSIPRAICQSPHRHRTGGGEGMPREQIIRMAREAGWGVRCFDGIDEVMDGDAYHIQTDEVERFAALVAAAEREACAKVCESLFDLDDDSCSEAEQCAAAIRARGEE